MNIIEIEKFKDEYVEQDFETFRIKKRDLNFVPCGFDIETTTQYSKDDTGKVLSHYTNMYIGQFAIGDNVLLFRDWDIFSEIIFAIKKIYCQYDTDFLMFIQNVGFEFSFMAKELEYRNHKVEVFARQKRHPLKVIIDDNIIILDTSKLTGMSLKKLAENYTKTQKLVGDLQYDLVRNKYTKLDRDTELQYCINDVVILKEYAEYYAREFLENNQLPMTQTMIANETMKKTIVELNAKDERVRLMREAYPKTRQQYDYIMMFFSGAYTHGNLRILFQIIFNCLSYDMSSQYPYCCMSKYFPMSKFKVLHDLSKAKYYISKYCCLIDITFTDIKSKYGITFLSKHKLIECDGCIWDNGRLLEGKSCRAFITEVDFKNLRKHYKFKHEINQLTYAKRGQLPDYFKLTIAELYAQKSRLKGNLEKLTEYACAKASLNGESYGACCTRILPEEVTYKDGSWVKTDSDYNFATAWRTKDKLPQWAVYITSWARFMIGDSIYRICKKDPSAYLYSDTDSNKVRNEEWIKDIFNDINNEIIQGNQDFINHLQLREKYPDIDFDTMGTFQNEYPQGISRFKTLGAKKYIYEVDGEINTTVAGLPKGIFVKYCNKHKLDPFKSFELNNLVIVDNESDKLCAYYVDEPKQFTVTDYQGNTEEVLTQSYVSLIPTSFKFKENINQYKLAKGYFNMTTNLKVEVDNG